VDPEISLSHLRNIFLYWHGLRIYFGSRYIFLVCRGVRGPSFSKKLDFLFSGSKTILPNREIGALSTEK
jgi:hypothetical protein